MSDPTSGPKKKLPLAKLALAGGGMALVALVAVVVVGVDPTIAAARGGIDWGVAKVTGAGPAVYFGALAVLPIIGVPASPFAIAAGPLFGQSMGLPAIIACTLAAVTLNLTLAYWLARRWLRPLIGGLIEKSGYRMPQMRGEDVTDVILLVRVTPGPPFFMQNYLLGLGGAPFGRYMAISCAVQWLYTTGFILFGEALSKGKGKLALTAMMLLAALAVATHMLRKHLARKKAAAAAA
jgi:uncharacterized membrane protein YdjX (TVP38/TMEM64 family)